MTTVIFSLLVFVCVFLGGMLGMFLGPRLPDQHVTSKSRYVVRLGMGLVATTVALVLGLLVASAKTCYDTQYNEITQLAAKVVLLDRILAHDGPDAAESRSSASSPPFRASDFVRLPAIILRRNFQAALRMDEGADGVSRRQKGYRTSSSPREFRMRDDFNTPKPA